MEAHDAMPWILGLLLALNVFVFNCYSALKKINNNLVHAMDRLNLLGPPVDDDDDEP